VPKQRTHEYEHLCRIIDTIKEAIAKESEKGPRQSTEHAVHEGEGYEIRVTDPKSPLCGQVVYGYIVYFDINHTGNSPDLIHATTREGKRVKLLSSQCDMGHYKAQELAEQVKRLGAKIGDKVRIVKSGSGTYGAGWRDEGVHEITNIDNVGYVEFDHGLGSMFRPAVEVVGVHDG